MPSLVLIDLQTPHGELLPSTLEGLPHLGALRVRSTLSMVQVNLPANEARARVKAYNGRAAVGADEIWQRFPEYRDEFLAHIERRTMAGSQQLAVPLKNTILGDVRINATLTLLERPAYENVSQPSSMQEQIDVPDSELTAFPQLIASEKTNISVIERYLYFCDGLSVVGGNGNELAPGIRFLSPRMLLDQTDFTAVIADRGKPPQGFPPALVASWPRPYVPDKFSGAFLVDSPVPENRSYTDALVNRTLAAAALAGAAYGKIPLVLRLRQGGWEGSPQDRFAGRPYHDRSLPETYTVTTKTRIFAEVLLLLKSVTPQKFVSAKEDFRLMALDTIEDSRRSGVAVLEFSQIWMAIERLLPFRTETTAQLALSLSAFVNADQRTATYKALKKSYGLRSEIVHGYSFAKNEPIQLKTLELSNLFRSVFSASLKVSSSDELRECLIGHVLEGRPGAFE